MTEQDRKEMQVQFEKETGTKVVNSQGEYDIDYVSWLEAKVFSSNAVLAVTSDSKENNKESEVAVAFAVWLLNIKSECDMGYWSVGHKDFKKEFYTTEELYEIFKQTAKATDR